jgi:hypothetical protein
LPYSGPKFGPCTIFDVTYPSDKFPASPDALLDAGSKLVLSGPNVPVGFGAAALPGPSGPIYTNSLSPGTLKDGALYTLTGAGGTQVGPFIASATLPTAFTVTNLNSLAPIDRSKPLTINWTGSGFDAVLISLNGTTTASSITHQVVVSCAVPAGPGAYTIPAAALAYLPPVSGNPSVGQMVITATSATDGVVSSQSSTAQTLTPPLVGGGQADFGSFTAFSSFVKTVTIQ